MIRILSVARIGELGDSRKFLLQTAGYQVETARDAASAIRALEAGGIDLVIVGHAVAHPEDSVIVAAARKHDAPVLLLYEDPKVGRSENRLYFDVKDGADNLLRIVNAVNQRRSKSRQ